MTIVKSRQTLPLELVSLHIEIIV